MADAYTHKKLTDVKDSAPEFGFGEVGEARFAREAFDAEQAGFSYHRLNPNKRQAFGHKHDEAEEVYVVVSGSGRLKLDDEVLEIVELDAIRISPEVTRALEAGDDGLAVLCFGQHFDKDGELVQEWWTD
jgi:mannose-6-phosphate isomerase-like protein (cupin superfamily)